MSVATHGTDGNGDTVHAASAECDITTVREMSGAMLPEDKMCVQIIRRITTAQRYAKMPHFDIRAALKNLKGAMFFRTPRETCCRCPATDKKCDGFGRHATKD